MHKNINSSNCPRPETTSCQTTKMRLCRLSRLCFVMPSNFNPRHAWSPRPRCTTIAPRIPLNRQLQDFSEPKRHRPPMTQHRRPGPSMYTPRLFTTVPGTHSSSTLKSRWSRYGKTGRWRKSNSTQEGYHQETDTSSSLDTSRTKSAGI